MKIILILFGTNPEHALLFLAFSCERPAYERTTPLSWKRRIPFSSAICFNLAFFASSCRLQFLSSPGSPLSLFCLSFFSFPSALIQSPPICLRILQRRASSLTSPQIYPLPHFTHGNPSRPNNRRNLGCAGTHPPSNLHVPPQDIPDSQTFPGRDSRRCGVSTWAAHFGFCASWTCAFRIN